MKITGVDYVNVDEKLNIWQVILSTEPKAPQFTCFCMGETLL